MLPTPLSLLVRLRDDDESSWQRFVQLYSPLLIHWLRRYGLQDADLEDLVQDVLLKVSKHVATFDRQREGSFRTWLKTISVNQFREYARAKKMTLSASLSEVPAPETEAFWETEYKQKLICSALMLMRKDFQETTWKACWEQVINERAPAELAKELGISLESVYSARSRVLKRLREELAGLID